MLHRTPAAVALRLMDERPGMAAMPSASASARIEEAFGWIKTIAGQQKSRFRGRDRVGWAFTFAAAAYDLVRLPKLIAEAC